MELLLRSGIAPASWEDTGLSMAMQHITPKGILPTEQPQSVPEYKDWKVLGTFGPTAVRTVIVLKVWMGNWPA